MASQSIANVNSSGIGGHTAHSPPSCSTTSYSRIRTMSYKVYLLKLNLILAIRSVPSQPEHVIAVYL